jgi:hypothetical protein
MACPYRIEGILRPLMTIRTSPHGVAICEVVALWDSVEWVEGFYFFNNKKPYSAPNKFWHFGPMPAAVRTFLGDIFEILSVLGAKFSRTERRHSASPPIFGGPGTFRHHHLSPPSTPHTNTTPLVKNLGLCAPVRRIEDVWAPFFQFVRNCIFSRLPEYRNHVHLWARFRLLSISFIFLWT